MALFQGVNPQGMEGARMALLQRLQAQMGARQQNRQKMGQLMPASQQPGGPGSAGAAIGRPLGVGQMRGSLGRQGITQGDNVGAAIMARLGAINPRALRGEFSSAPGMGARTDQSGMMPVGFGPHYNPGGPMIPAPSPGGGPAASVNAPGMGNAAAAPGGAPVGAPGAGGVPTASYLMGSTDPGAPAPPLPAPPSLGNGQFGQVAFTPSSPGNDTGTLGPSNIEQAQGLVPLGGGRFFDPVTGAIRGGDVLGGAAGLRFGR